MNLFKRKKNPTPTNGDRERPLVLVADDEEDLCRLIRLALLPNGIDVDMAFDGEEALRLIRERKPELVLLDIKMPRMNGYQVLASMQQDRELKGIPVIIITSLTTGDKTDDDQGWAKRMGVERFISKPFDAELVVEAVKSELAKRN